MSSEIPGSRVTKKLKPSYTAPREIMEEVKNAGDHEEVMPRRTITVADRESDYVKRRYLHQLSPERVDAFADKTPDLNKRRFGDIMTENQIENERVTV